MAIGGMIGVGASFIDGFDPGPEPIEEDAVESEMIRLINEERSNEGLENLREMDIASSKARSHSERMSEYDEVAHDLGGTTTDGRLADISCRPGGENVALAYLHERVEVENGTMYASSSKEAAELLMTSWMNSEPHRENILDPQWTVVGVGVEVSEQDDVYATQIFCQ